MDYFPLPPLYGVMVWKIGKNSFVYLQCSPGIERSPGNRKMPELHDFV